MELNPGLQIGLNLTLSPQMQYALTILQMDATAVLDHVRQQAMENPLIDLDALYIPSHHISWEQKDTWTIPDKHNKNAFREDLYDQLPVGLHADLEWAIRQLIHLLEPSGYLQMSKEDLTESLGIPTGLLEDALSLLHSLEPAGIGAASLTDCLKLQLQRSRDDSPLLSRLADCYLPDIAAGRLRKIAKAEGVSLRHVEVAVQRIRTLSPHPLTGLRDSETSVHIVPDIIVGRDNGELIVSISKNTISILPRDSTYEKLLTAGGNPSLASYLRECSSAFGRLNQAVSMRAATLLAVADCIVKRQEGFFLNNSPLLPLSLKDISQELGLHISTISKALQNKYLVCAQGTFPLRYFLSRYKIEEGGVSEQSVSQDQICHAIRELIAAEDPGAPLSDQQLFTILQSQGLVNSRRTIAFYRKKEGIPSSYSRKR